MAWKGLLNQYKEYLPVNESTPLVTLYEGNTPLIKSENIGRDLGIDLYFKYEGLNPTGSFKDRGMVMAIAKALESGSNTIMCASTGNTSASAAAYGARYGLNSIVLIPDGYVALGKLAQALQYGTNVVAIQGNFDDALNLVKEITTTHPITLVNSLNPFRLEGQKTGAFEIVDALGDAPDYLAIPVGNAGNITAYWKGFKEYKQNSKSTKLPIMKGYQAEGASPIVQNRIFADPQTVATAIRIGNPASWEKALKARDESGGTIKAVSDEEILQAYKLLSSQEGIFTEPASSASLAGIIKSVENGDIKKGSKVVAILTGNGLKDPDTCLSLASKPKSITGALEEVLKLIER
ncbi:threonine synthase [Peptostreptococcus sp. D1]|uniref:threonine synthase n=1 Tax=Peptostreptococcus sp. D1 TaxID=72304 RepID=UPI0008F1E328|nr:threonine synthase [Peptostreptococcus sp. D1]SFE58466.1 threonine synthase [Peptostreptococcus sp. D1]